MKSLIVAVSAILLVVNLVHSAVIKGAPTDAATHDTAPVPDGTGDLNSASTFFWPIFGGYGGWGGYGGYGGWGYPLY